MSLYQMFKAQHEELGRSIDQYNSTVQRILNRTDRLLKELQTVNEKELDLLRKQ
jgi:hypothetical protein